MARSTYNDSNSACHGGPCPSDKDGEISSGKTQQTVANVALAVGVVGAAARSHAVRPVDAQVDAVLQRCRLRCAGGLGLRGVW